MLRFISPMIYFFLYFIIIQTLFSNISSHCFMFCLSFFYSFNPITFVYSSLFSGVQENSVNGQSSFYIFFVAFRRTRTSGASCFLCISFVFLREAKSGLPASEGSIKQPHVRRGPFFRTSFYRDVFCLTRNLYIIECDKDRPDTHTHAHAHTHTMHTRTRHTASHNHTNSHT